MEEGILEIQPRTHSVLLEPPPDCFKFFHLEIYMTNVFVELFQIQDWYPFARRYLRFLYCKVCTNILALYLAHLANSTLLKESCDFNIENFGCFFRDDRITRSNPLPRSFPDPDRFVTSSDNVKAALVSSNSPVTVPTVSQSATQLHL